jgi:integrase
MAGRPGQYLEKRRRRYYAVLEVPKDLRKTLGKARFVQSLKTDSLALAERLKWPVINAWKLQIERARTGNESTLALLEELERKYEGGESGYDPEHGHFKFTSQDLQSDHMGLLLEAETVPEHVLQAAGVVLSGKTLLAKHIEQFANRGNVTDEAKASRLRILKALVSRFPFAEDVSVQDLAEWVEVDLIEGRGLARGTVRNYSVQWRNYWEWLQTRHGLKIQNPFSKSLFSDLQQLATAPVQRQVWEPEEYRNLLSGLEEDDPLHALIQVAAHTGLRRQAICSLRLEDVLEDRFLIQKRKFETTSREFPIHSAILPVVEKLKAASDGEWLFPIKGEDEKFAHNMGERFRVYKNGLGYPREKTFHSFRHTVATQLHKAQVAPHVVDLLLGWSVKGGSTGLRVYTKADFPAMQQAIENVKY